MMHSKIPVELRQALMYLRAGRQVEARKLLSNYLRRRPNSAAAWWMLSFAVDQPYDQVLCLQQVLRVNPNHTHARARLSQIKAPDAPSGSVTAQQGVQGSEARRAVRRRPDFDPLRDGPPTVRLSTRAPERAMLERSHRGKRGVAASTPGPLSTLKGVWRAMLATVGVSSGVEGGRRARGRPMLLSVFGAFGLLFLCAALGLVSMVAMVRGVRAAQSQTFVWPTELVITPTPYEAYALVPTPNVVVERVEALPPSPPSTRAAVLMGVIESEVSDLRGLPIADELQLYLVTEAQANRLLEDHHTAALGGQGDPQDQARALHGLGLIGRNDELDGLVSHRLSDPLGGFYLSEGSQLFVIGEAFGPRQRLAFAHEFASALVERRFELQDAGHTPYCPAGDERCVAVRALVQGDAAFVAERWLDRFASGADRSELGEGLPRWDADLEERAPAYLKRDLTFAFEVGREFVEYLYNRGGWARVDQVYADPPESTEQILHPWKYIAGEGPREVPLRPLAEALGGDWRLIRGGSLGEWDTYLILGSGAEPTARLEERTARSAAQGWGGDNVQIFHNDRREATALAVHWAWDNADEASEFYAAMSRVLGGRFHGAAVEARGSRCWESESQISCLYATSRGETLWLLAPDLATIDAMQAQFPEFR